MEQFNVIAEQKNSTVMSQYQALPREDKGYQSEAALEEAFIHQLKEQGYERVNITSEKALIANLREQICRLNGLELSDSEWKQLFEKYIASPQMTIEDKTERIQQKEIVNITLDNGDSQNIKLIDKSNIHNNHLQVLNQYVPEGGKHANRYDVTILVNGLPLVHCELKRRGVPLKEAFNQINRYERDSFWAGCGLYDYIQIFIISNGTESKYYSNTTRFAHVAEVNKQKRRVKTQSQSFEFTSYWADAENKAILDIRDFTRTFLAKHSLLNILTKYCVFTVDKNLMVMRPYQIAATERILLRIKQATYNKWQGSIKAGGYIWHTTGSGKTLTSFKTAQLASELSYIDKVLFIVDRKDLDYQTMKEYDNFEKGCANSNTSSNILQRQLNDPTASKKIIITTIQKLASLLKKNKEIKCADGNVVMIFDECHRSQFGEMHVKITKSFKKYYIFGFTGTPIFAKNAGAGKFANLRTTAQAFGGEPDEEGHPTRPLHTYTIIDAIRDKNVLQFKVDYIQTVKAKDDIDEKKVWGIETDQALQSPVRIANNVSYILEHYAQKTKQQQRYGYSVISNVIDVAKNNKVQEEKQKRQLGGFNSIFCVDSIPTAIKYYLEFKKQQENKPEAERLRIATIFTYSANEAEDENGTLPDEDPGDTSGLDATSREFLDSAIDDYNAVFNTKYSTDGEKFQNYYKDLSLRMKNREVDLLIVVSMFLTGFDAKTLNTLWVDKNLKMHGLLQAYSRTNRILNSIKDCGNIVCFRNLEEATNESFALFGDKDAAGVILMRPFNDYYYGYEDENGKHIHGYKEIAEALLSKYALPINPMEFTLEQKKEFVKLFGGLLKMQNLLSAFDEFNEQNQIISDFDQQDYLTWYNDLHEELRPSTGGEKESIEDDLVFEMELVKQIQINIPYILALVKQYHDENSQDKTIIAKIQKAIGSSPDLRDKKDLIMRFIDRMTPTPGTTVSEVDIDTEWTEFVDQEREQELKQIIKEENLREEETRRFIDQSFADGYVTTTGLAITKVFPPMPIFGGGNVNREEKKNTVLAKLTAFFNKFFNV